MENESIKVNIRISREVKKFYEDFSKEVGAPQSALMALALKEYMDQKTVLRELPLLLNKVNEIESKVNGNE